MTSAPPRTSTWRRVCAPPAPSALTGAAPTPATAPRDLAVRYQPSLTPGPWPSSISVCCIYKTNECGTTIAKNISYIQNPNFPSTYSTTGTCSFKITKTVAEICQVRLDFDTMVLGGNGIGGTAAGCCGSTCAGDMGTAGDHAADSLTVAGKTGRDPPVICHTNTGYHSE